VVAESQPPASNARLIALVHLLFFLSGIPALFYQIAWLRALFVIYGTNIEAVTAVVAAFLLGLGAGSLAGGAISVRWPRWLLPAFAAIELGIAAYGALSMTIFEAVGGLTAGSGVFWVGALSFALIVLPTLLMGATLPILVAFLVRATGRVGVSIGGLYFANTLGAAFACFLAMLATMRFFGLSGTVLTAASLNAVIGLSVLAAWLLSGRPTAAAVEDAKAVPVNTYRATGRGLGLARAMLLSAAAGYISLSYEILWVRTYSIALQGSAFAFPLVLGFFLFGVALGAVFGRHLSAIHDKRGSGGRACLQGLILSASVAGYLIVPLMAHGLEVVSILLTLPLVTLGATFWGAVLPLLSQLSLKADRTAGRGLSWLYAANIAGTVAGSLITGFVLLDHLSLRDVLVSQALLGLIAALALLQPAGRGRRRAVGYAALVVSVAVLLLLTAPTLFAKLYDRLHFRGTEGVTPIVRVVENKSGVIAVNERLIVYGGGAYDGAFNVDPLHDINDIFRIYALSGFHGRPANVLMIGLASGSWAQIIVHHPEVERLTVVEINPGYLELIAEQPVVRSLLENPKVDLVVDDGRRWLRRYRGPPFDAVIINTTFHWRAFATSLLSQDFFRLIKTHLKPSGVLYFNATNSLRVLRTAALSFADTFRYSSFVFASDSKIDIDVARWRRVFENYRIDGKPVLPSGRASQQLLAKLGRMFEQVDQRKDDPWFSIESKAMILQRSAGKEIITDDNMGDEWGSH